ncbi:MAG: SDR family oxidoreductase [Oscillochloris sp.]|nr:SDR family oxidoreductase [Oscillochloris sp.]
MIRQQKNLLAGKVAVVTGSTQGLGLAIARSYAEAGAAVVVSNHQMEDVRQAVEVLRQQGAQVTGHVCDVREQAQVFGLADAALAAFGTIDIWVNNAGVTATQGPVVAIAPEVFTRVVATNILGTYHGSLAALRHMSPRRSGKLINMVGQGERKPNPYGNAYGSSKAWIRHFTLALAHEERANGLGIFTLNPGLLDTELTRRMTVVAGYEARAQAFDTIARLVAVPAEESAQLALRLAGPDTDGRTGIELRAPTFSRLLRGLTRELARRALRRPAPRQVSYVSLPPDHERTR